MEISKTDVIRDKPVIVHIIQRASPGGIEQLALELYRLTSHTHKLWIVSLEGSKQELLDRWPRLAECENQLICLEKPSGVSLDTIRKISAVLKALKPQIVHTHHIGPLVYAGLATLLNKDVRLVHTEHDAWHLNCLKHRIYQRLLFKVSEPRLIADADFVAKRLTRWFSNYPVEVIKNGIDTDIFTLGSKDRSRIRLELSQYDIWLGCAGRLEHVKGQDVLIYALKQLPKNYKLVIAGAGSQRDKLEKLVRDLELSERVKFLGLVDDMPTFYQALDLFVLPSRKEGFPLSTLEAQSCGINVVATNVGGTKETVCSNTGMTCSADNPNELATAIVKSLSSSQQCPRSFVVKNNDIQSMVLQYANVWTKEYSL
ncbi:glycosyltransferase [Vibrio sonorensis]|uniref:glycosyltransferase n=1 Tax=Vibrio sonorensis TaxID=1004316 RepID=UPI0008D959F4|nr:glycosyltransferase [Vibrio sonorensis]